MTKEQKQKMLAGWYENLPAKLQGQLRQELMDLTQISKSSFYNYIHGRVEIPNYLFSTGIVPFISKHRYEYKNPQTDTKTVETEK